MVFKWGGEALKWFRKPQWSRDTGGGGDGMKRKLNICGVRTSDKLDLSLDVMNWR